MESVLGIQPMIPLAKPAGISGEAKVAETTGAQGPSFSQFLQDALKEVNQSQLDSDKLTQGLVTGQVSDLHQVMIAAEKASINMQLTLQLRNKMVEAYQEIMRMQV